MGETWTTACAKIGPVSYLRVTCTAQLLTRAIAVISQSHEVQPQVLGPFTSLALTEWQACADRDATRA